MNDLNTYEETCRPCKECQKNKYVGCYKDSNQRDLTNKRGNMTLEQCQNEAILHNTKYFGLQYHNGVSKEDKSTDRSEC